MPTAAPILLAVSQLGGCQSVRVLRAAEATVVRDLRVTPENMVAALVGVVTLESHSAQEQRELTSSTIL